MLKIITDSSANLTAEEAESMGIKVLPFPVIFGERTFLDGVNLSTDEFYRMLANDPDHPHTSQINVAQFEEVFSGVKPDDEVIVILLSSALSGTVNSARIAKENLKLDNIHIYDSFGATVMEKMLVLAAYRNRDKTPKQVISILDDLRSRMEIYAIVDTLEYLYKGGRLKKSAATLGKIFRIKPIVTVSKDGFVDLCGKAIGTAAAIKNVAKRIETVGIDPDYPPCYIYSADNELCRRMVSVIDPDNADKCVANASNLCPVIGVHIGHGAAGICFIRKK